MFGQNNRVLFGAVLVVTILCGVLLATDSAQVRDLFSDPPAQYSSLPLWVWADWMTDEMIVQSLRDLAGQNVRQVCLHARPGLLTPVVTEKFIEITMEPYRKRFGEAFGGLIKGVFTDEPGVQPAGGLPWCSDLPERFEERWGYSLMENLPSLRLPLEGFRSVRHDYWLLVLDLFIERWAKPHHHYCQKHGLKLNGEYFEHSWPSVGRGPDNMAMYAWLQQPAIDTLYYQYSEKSGSYHQPWWEAYSHLENYYTRLSAALSQGRETNRILVIEPTTTAWMYAAGGRVDPDSFHAAPLTGPPAGQAYRTVGYGLFEEFKLLYETRI